MKILSIETSCDETAVSIVEAEGRIDSPSFSVLGNALYSQIAIHKEYGGVYPMMAKREHAKNLSPILAKAMTDAGLFTTQDNSYSNELWNEIEKILEREEGLYLSFKNTFEKIKKPDLDVITVTSGPGLEPALWVGISFAIALGKLWKMPVIGANHMEGHIASVLISNEDKRVVEFPALAVLISGGHTEIVHIENWGKYKVIGQTVDDAIGEAFDKVARIMGLPYPGGPEISKLAEIARTENIARVAKLPRPMIRSGNLNFSFSGLKTAALYYIRDHFDGKFENMTEENKADLAREFEEAVIDVLKEKTTEAINSTGSKTVIVGGGVVSSNKIKEVFTTLESVYNGLIVKTPAKGMATDNALMIAASTYMNILINPGIMAADMKIIAKGNLGFE